MLLFGQNHRGLIFGNEYCFKVDENILPLALISAVRCRPSLDVRGTLVSAALFSPVNAGRYGWSV